MSKSVELLKEHMEKIPNGMHGACVIWYSPVSKMWEIREGFFPEFCEAQMFGDGLAKKYREYGFWNAVYVDGEIVGGTNAQR